MRLKNDTKSILLHLGILFAITIPFWIFNIDLKVHSLFYDFSTNLWKYAGTLPVKLLYHYGVYPALIMTAFAAVVFGLGFTYKKMAKHRKISLLIMLALFIGPAVTINVILKNYTGRPRPREIKEFNGRLDFRNVLQLGTPGRGYSFPCGHASMGFLFTALYFVYRRKNKTAAYTALFGGLVFGAALGAARMAQGGHFLSDVIWSAGITFISAEIAWKILGGDDKDTTISIFSGGGGKTVSTAVIASLLAALVIIFLFSVPFANDRHYNISHDAGPLELIVNTEGNVRLKAENNTDFIVLKANGFGFPKRHFDGKLDSEKTKAGMKYIFTTVKKGFFAELNSNIDIYLPKASEYRININTSKGNLEYSLAGNAPLVILYTKSGDIDFKAGGEIGDIFLKTGSGDAETVINENTKLLPSAFIDINVNGMLFMANRSVFFKELNEKASDITGSKEIYYKSTREKGPAMSVKARKIIIIK